MLTQTPHGAEILQLEASLTALHLARLDAEFAALLARRGREAADAGADLAAFPDAEGFASFLAAAGSGLKHVMRTEEAFRSAIHRLACVAACAAGLA